VRTLLEAQGVATFLDRQDLKAGLPWGQALEEALGGVRAVAVFFGPAGLGEWQKREIGFALERQVREGAFPVVPVLLPGARPELSFLISNNTWVDLRDGPTSPEGIRALVEAARGRRPAPRAEILTGFCPFLGLKAFAEEDAPFFCGRKKFADNLLQMILTRGLVAVVGASGSGKSSVIHAGLLPALRRQRPPAATWGAISLTPKDEPFHKLAASVLPLLEPELTEPKRLAEARDFAEDLRTGKVPLKDVVNRVLTKSRGTDRLLIIVDQFEELLTLTPKEQQRPFVDMLLQAPQESCSLLLSLRGELYGHALGLSRELSDRLQQRVINVGPMTRDELKQAIKGPAQLVGLQFEEGLVTTILDDATGQPGHLPLLEFALTELCQGRDSNVLTYDRYETIGRVVGAIAQKADRIFNAFDKERQEITRRLFTQLVRVARPDEGTVDTRRRALWSELGPWAGTALGDEVIHKWAGERLIAITGGQGEEPLGIELAHEALLREWPGLAAWINGEREDLLTRHWLADEAAAWEKNGREPGYLLSAGKLDRAQSWSKDHGKELADRDREFLRQSELAEQRRREEAQALLDTKTALAEEQTLRYEEERQHTRKLTLSRRRLRQVVGVLIAAFFAVTVLAFCSNTLRHREERARLAVTWRNLLLGSAAKLGNRPETSLLLALEALRLTSEQPELSAFEAEESLRQALAKAAGKPLGHDDIQAIGISPDHRWLATAGEDGTVMVWDLAAADPAKKPTILKSQEGRVSKIAVSSEGRFVAIYTQDDQDQAQDAVRVWNLPEKARDPSWVLQGEDWLGSTPFSPDGHWLVTRENNLVVRDLSHGAQPVGELAGTPTALAFDPQAPRLATGESSGDVILWDLSSRTLIRKLTASGGETRALAFSPDGRWLVSAGADGSVTGWHGLEKESETAPLAFGRCGGKLDSLEIDPRGTRLLGWGGSSVCLWELEAPATAVKELSGLAYTAATFNRDGSEMFFSGQGKVMQWSAAAVERLLWDREGPPITLLAVVDRRWLVAGGAGLVPRLFDLRKANPGDPDEPRTLRTPGAPFTAIVLSSDGSSLAAGQANGKIFLRDLERQEAGLVSLLQQEPVTALAFSPDRRVLASGGKGGGILLHDLASPQPLAPRKHPESVTALALSPESRWLVAGGADGGFRFWQLPSTGPEERLVNHPGGVTAVTFSRDGRWLATAGADGKRVWPWPLPSQARPTVLEPRKGRIMALAFSPDGQFLATGCADGTTQLWYLAQTPPGSTSLAGHNLDVIALAFSADGRKLASGSRDRTVRLWSLGQQGSISQPTTLRGHEDEVRAVAFSPDGHWLVSADARGTVRRWNLHLDELKRLACEKAGRNLTGNEWHDLFGTEAYHPTCPELPSEP
jgi:WD40 repeat protein